jgi:hypothetical protein
MEMRGSKGRNGRLATLGLFACLLLLAAHGKVSAQDGSPQEMSYTVREGRMCIILGRHVDKLQLDNFIDKYDLSDLDLPKLLFSSSAKQSAKLLYRQLRKMGWRVDADNPKMIVISKQMLGVGGLNDPEKRMVLTEDHPNTYDLFPPQNDNLVYGFNRFVGKFPFAVRDSLVTFFMKGHISARRVLLAGSFTNWQHEALEMTRTDSGWIAVVELEPGKYWYKFIIDGGWTIDPDNDLNEDDGLGNTNSVYYKTNIVFTLPGFLGARDGYLSGSFNNWNPGELPMNKGPFGWSINVYLAEGTFTYKFMVDGKWYADPKNNNRLPDGRNGFNSLLRLGKSYHFALRGYTSARSVVLAGSFNGWKTYELFMQKTATGWELPYTLGPGNYEYRFLVEGKWINDPVNPLFINNTGNHTVNSYLIVAPNYAFRLQGYDQAKTVFLAGDFNNWTPDALPMKRVGNAWVFKIHLSVGKHLYKFIVDDRWIKDPEDPLWEANEYGTDNSVIWWSARTKGL